MLRAELHGKLPREARYSEDVLTSNVFGFFEVADRRILQRYLQDALGIDTTVAEAEEAIFTFWPSYADGTEPDLVLEVGRWYLLVEAKLQSGFGQDQSDEEQNQLRRELREGRAVADNANRLFRLVTITKESFCDRKRYPDVQDEDLECWCWTNWQRVTQLLDEMKDEECGHLGLQLRELLHNRSLRGFRGFGRLGQTHPTPPSVFWQTNLTRFSGGFVGFNRVLRGLMVPSSPSQVFWVQPLKFQVEWYRPVQEADTVFWEGDK